MAYVYRHVRLDKNEVFYIGIGSDDNYRRAHSLRGRNKYWINIVNKSKYRIDIIFDELSWEDACLKEIEFISLYGRIDNKCGTLVNMTDGGEGKFGVLTSYETRIKMSKSRIGKKKGPHSADRRLKMSQSHKGKVFSQEHRKKIIESNSGQTRECMCGCNNPKSKPVIDMQTGIFYDSIKDASIAIGIEYKLLWSYLKGICKNKTNISYL